MNFNLQLGFSPRQRIDADVIAFSNRVVADGGTVEDINFLNSFVKDAKLNNYYSDIVAAYSPSWGVKGTTTASKLYSITGASTDIAQTTGGSQPAINIGDLNGKSRLLLDGVDDMFTRINFAWSQPETVIFGGFEQESWTSADQFTDGFFGGVLKIFQTSSSPGLQTTSTASNSDAPIGTPVHLRALFNEASSATQIDDNAEKTGTEPASGFGGYTLGSRGGSSPTAFANFSFGFNVLLAAAEDGAYQAKASAIKAFSASAYGTS